MLERLITFFFKILGVLMLTSKMSERVEAEIIPRHCGLARCPSFVRCGVLSLASMESPWTPWHGQPFVGDSGSNLKMATLRVSLDVEFDRVEHVLPVCLPRV